MTCGDVREYLFAFLDNELDGPLSMELQRHLDRCHDCAREVEIERAIRKQLDKAFEEPVTDIPPLNESLLAVYDRDEPKMPTMTRPSGLLPRLRWTKSFGVAAVMALLLGAGAWLILKPDGVNERGISLTEMLVSDFEHFLQEGQTVQIASADRRAQTRRRILRHTPRAP